MNDAARTLAEQATIGALMLKPDSIGVVQQWLRRSDFSQRWLGDLYVRLRERHHAGDPCDAHSVGLAMLADGRSAPRHTIPRLVDLLQAAPVHPDPIAYARLVLDSGIRREVDGLGVVLRAGALAAANQLNPAPLRNTATEVNGLLRGSLDRWRQASGVAAPGAWVHDDGQRSLDLRLGADRFLRAQPNASPAEGVGRERRLVGALIVRPAAAASIGDTLHPEWFVDRRWAAGYAAILDLTATQQQVDAVTVACRAHELSAAFGAAPTSRDVLDAAEHSLTVDPFRAAAAVSADLTVRTAESAAASMGAAARRPGLTVPDVIDTSRTLVAATVTASAGMGSGVQQPREAHGAAPSRVAAVGSVAG